MDKTPVAGGGGGFGGHEGLGGGDMDETPTKKPRKTPAKKQQAGKAAAQHAQADNAAASEEAAKEQVGVKIEAEDDMMDEDEAV